MVSLQVLEALPYSLLQSILSASLLPLAHMLTVLPKQLHVAALYATYPSIAANNTLKLSRRDVLANKPTVSRLWELISTLSSLQHVSVPRVGRLIPNADPLQALTSLTRLEMVFGAPFQSKSTSISAGWKLGHLRLLRRLDLSRSKLGTSMSLLAVQLKQLTDLEHLDLSGNSLGARGALPLSQCLCKLASLQHLALSGNKLECNGMRTLAPRIAPLTHLVFLDAADNKLAREGQAVLAELLLKLPRLRHLRMSSVRVCKKVLPRLSTLTTLNHLHVDSIWKMNHSLLKELTQQLSHLKKIRHVNLARCRYTDAQIIELAPSLGLLPELQILNLRRNPIEQGGMKALQKYVGHRSSVQSLELHAHFKDCLVQFLQTLPCLQHLFLHLNGPCAYSVAAGVAEVLSCITNMRYLELSMGVHRVTQVYNVLAGSLTSLTRLQKLVLDGWDLRFDAVRILAPVIGDLTCLTQLSVRGFGEDGMCHSGFSTFCVHLTQLKCLQSLSLQINAGHGGAEALVQALKELSALTFLGFFNSRFQNTDADHLKSFWSRHGPLQHMSFKNSTILSQNFEGCPHYTHTRGFECESNCSSDSSDFLGSSDSDDDVSDFSSDSGE